MSRKWYYFKNGKAVGPVEWGNIIELYEANNIKKATKIWCNEFSDWLPLSRELKQKQDKSTVSPPPLPNQNQQPPPLRKDKQFPPPLPKKQSSTPETGDKKINVGPIQSKGDYIASQTITKVSFVILSILGTLTVIGLLSRGFQENNSSTKKASQKWPSSFGFDNPSTFDPKPPSLSQALVEDIYYAEGFKIGQDKSINVLSNLFPELSRKLFLAQTEFDSEFGSAFDKIDQTLSSKLSDWNQRKEAIRNSVSDKLSYTNISKSDAEQFLHKVENRVDGKLPSPVLETILMFHPKYISNPRLMYNDGYTKEYRSSNSSKAKGIDLAIEYPSSWKAEEGRRPNVVQKFTSENGYGLEIVTIVIKDFPKEIAGKFSEEDILLLSGENIWDNVSQNTTTIDEGNVTLANKPSIWGEFSGSINRTGIILDIHGLGFAMVDGETMIQISFMIAQQKGKNNFNIESKFNHFAPTFQMMLNSLDFYDKYN